MSLETQIAALVTAANNLTGAVNGKMGQIDQKVDDAEAAYLAQLETLKNRLPRLLVSKNMRMLDSEPNNVPDNWGQHVDVTGSKVMQIITNSEAAGRPADQIALLAQIEADVKEQFPDFDIRKSSYYRASFNIWQYQWSTLGASPYLAFPLAADQQNASLDSGHVPTNSYLTIAGFVKVVEGSISGSWANGNAPGKWRWCSTVLDPTNGLFAAYTPLHPLRASATGVVQCALVGACTGVVTHPRAWGTMMALQS